MQQEASIRTALNLDTWVMEDAMAHSEGQTKTEVVNEALRSFVRGKRQKELLELRGKVDWRGDLDELRRRTSSLDS